MILSSYLFRRVTIIGVGLMGGSLGKALKKHKVAKEVIGLSHRQSSLVDAMKINAIDQGFTEVPKAVRNADLVVLAAPVDSIVKLLSTINPHLKRYCIVTDVGSAKVEIIEAAQKVLTSPGNFVGSHPLVGSEKKGVAFANESLFEGAKCVMTPLDSTHNAVKDKVKKMWNKVGSEVVMMTPNEHDEALAYISHLPHLLAYSLMNVIPDKHLQISTQSLRDITRIASSSPQMWNDIFLANSKNLIHSLDELIGNLAELRKSITARDQKNLTQFFKKAKEKRDAIIQPES